MNLVRIQSNTNTNLGEVQSGTFEFYARGTFDGGKASLQRSDDGTNWIPIGRTGNLCELTAPGTLGFSVSSCYLRCVTTGGGAGIDIYVAANLIEEGPNRRRS
jgi:hypothetical protein